MNQTDNQTTSKSNSDALKDVRLERAALGIVLSYPKYADDICALLTPEVFTEEDHRIIFTACRNLNERGEAIDIISAGREIRRIEGQDFDALLAGLITEVSSGADWEKQCRVLQQLSFKRKLFYSLLESAPRLRAFDADMFEVMEQVQGTLNEIDDQIRRSVRPRDFAAILDENETQLYRRMECYAQGTMPGVNTGIASLNRATMGWQAKDLCILAGRPSMGKTAVALHFAKTAAARGSKVVFFSLEMSDTRLTQRLILSECDIPAEAVKSGNLTPEQAKRFIAAKDALKQRLSLNVIEKAGIEIGDLCRWAKSLRWQGKCDMVIVDYLQLVTVSRSERVGNREQEVALVSRRLKALAKDLNVPVIALAQLSRDVESSTGKDSKHIPSLRHLRESGAIEQDADMVSFVYRPAYYGIETWDDGRSTFGRGFIYIAKHRDGELGTCEFHHNEAMTKIFDPPAVGFPAPESEKAVMDLPKDCPF